MEAVCDAPKGHSTQCHPAVHDTLAKMKTSISAALKANLLPGLVLFALEGVLISVYFYCEPCGGFFTSLGQIKAQYGYFYSAVSTWVFGGLLPFLISILTGEIQTDRPKLMLQTFLLLLVLWSVLGVWVDVFYKFQSWLWGNDREITTIICKVSFDMFVYNPLVGIWSVLIPMHWRSCEFDCELFRDTLTVQFLLVTGSTVLVTVWMIWIPSVTVVYILPSDLQLPVSNIIVCFYNLILMFVTRDLAKSDSKMPNQPLEVELGPLTETSPLILSPSLAHLGQRQSSQGIDNPLRPPLV